MDNQIRAELSKPKPAQEVLALAFALIKNAVEISGDLGVTSGTIFAAFSAHGMSLSVYNTIIDTLVEVGMIRKSGNILYKEVMS